MSQLTIEFALEKNGAVAAQEVDAKVRTILSQLPEGTDAPIIDKFALDAAPVLTVAVSGKRDPREITEIARRRIKEDLESLSGVGAVILVGGRQRAIQISIDTDRLQKYEQLTIEDVRQALIRENQEQPGGRIDQGPRELVLRTMGRVREPADFAELIVANRHGQPIRAGASAFGCRACQPHDPAVHEGLAHNAHRHALDSDIDDRDVCFHVCDGIYAQ